MTDKAYPELPKAHLPRGGFPDLFTADQMRAYADATHALRAQQDDAYDHGPQAETVEEAARDVGKWLNERPNRPLDLRHVAMLTHHAKRTAHVQNPAEIEHVAGDVSKNGAESNMSTQPATQQEAQEPVAWYVTGCSRLLDEDDAKAEARHIGGTARAMPLYTAPQPSPTPQADSQPALPEITADCHPNLIAAELRRLHAETERLASRLKAYEDLGGAADDVQLLRMGYAAARLEIESLNAQLAAKPPAPRGEPVAWLNPWRADQVTTDYDAYGEHGIPLVRQQPSPTQPAQTADSVLEDAALLKEARDALWQPANVALCERIDAYLDAARKQGAGSKP